MADWFANRVLIFKNKNSENDYEKLAELIINSRVNGDEAFFKALNCPLERYIIEKLEILEDEIQLQIISGYRPVSELRNVCDIFKCDVHVVYAHERESSSDWYGEPLVGRYSACLKNGEIVYEQKKPDKKNQIEIHEYFSMAWNFTLSPDPIDFINFFDQNLIGNGFFIKYSEDDKKGYPPTLKQWLGLEEIYAPFGFIGYEVEEIEGGDTLTRKEVINWCRANPDAKEFNIREGVVTIEEKAFKDNRQIEKVVFAPTVKIVEGCAFVNSSVKQVILNEGVEEFRKKATESAGVFSYCFQKIKKRLYSVCLKMK